MNEVDTAEEVIESAEETISLVQELLPSLWNIAWKILLAVLFYLIASRLIKWICKILKRSMENHNAAPEAVSFLGSITKGGLYGLMIFSIATQFGLDSSSVAAVVASAGVALSLALQDSLSNIAGGVFILLMKPFGVGDYIIEENGNYEGTVLKIEMYYTTLVTVDNQKIVIPNSTLSDNIITNVTAMEERKLEILTDISYDSDLQEAKRILTELLMKQPEIHQEEEVLVFVESLQESSVRLGFRAWVDTDMYWQVKWRMNELIKTAFDEGGILIPYPQMDVHVKTGSSSEGRTAETEGGKKKPYEPLIEMKKANAFAEEFRRASVNEKKETEQ